MTVAIDPFATIWTFGFSYLQLKQGKLNKFNKTLKNTMNFGSSAGLVPASILKTKRIFNKDLFLTKMSYLFQKRSWIVIVNPHNMIVAQSHKTNLSTGRKMVIKMETEVL